MKFVHAVIILFSITVTGAVQSQARRHSSNGNSGFRCPDGKPTQRRPKTILRLGDLTKKAIELPRPKLPPENATTAHGGNVRAELIMDLQRGRIVWARVLDGEPAQAEAVRNVVCDVRFTPAMIDASTIMASGMIIYKFGDRENSLP